MRFSTTLVLAGVAASSIPALAASAYYDYELREFDDLYARDDYGLELFGRTNEAKQSGQAWHNRNQIRTPPPSPSSQRSLSPPPRHGTPPPRSPSPPRVSTPGGSTSSLSHHTSSHHSHEGLIRDSSQVAPPKKGLKAAGQRVLKAAQFWKKKAGRREYEEDLFARDVEELLQREYPELFSRFDARDDFEWWA